MSYRISKVAWGAIVNTVNWNLSEEVNSHFTHGSSSQMPTTSRMPNPDAQSTLKVLTALQSNQQIMGRELSALSPPYTPPHGSQTVSRPQGLMPDSGRCGFYREQAAAFQRARLGSSPNICGALQYPACVPATEYDIPHNQGNYFSLWAQVADSRTMPSHSQSTQLPPHQGDNSSMSGHGVSSGTLPTHAQNPPLCPWL